MLTVNDIREVTFNKSMSGYKTTDVDTFIDQCADTVANLTRSNAELEKKLEVLADKLVEYRNEEDSIRTALLSAQRLGDTVVREANHKAGLILEDAKIKAEKMQENAKRSIHEEERELERIRKEVSHFKSRLLSIYREHLALIDILPEENEHTEAEEKPPEIENPSETKMEQENVAVDSSENAALVQPPISPEQNIEIVNTADVLPDSANEEKEESDVPAMILEPNMETDKEATSNSRFSNLKFGEDYDISKDEDESALFYRHHK